MKLWIKLPYISVKEIEKAQKSDGQILHLNKNKYEFIEEKQNDNIFQGINEKNL